jgi:CDP-diacylglycerol---glycerol-3-phosphate 3-phosphatidyltransferase
MANLVTLGRLLLLYGVVMLVLSDTGPWALLNAPLLLIVIGLDAVDGWIARRRGETSRFGSIFDIVVDRVVENVLWLVLANLHAVPLWVAILFITRGFLVDGIRAPEVAAGATPFSVTTGGWGQVLVASRFMRGLYGTVKALTFGWLLLINPLPRLFPAFWAQNAGWAETIGDILIYLAVILCVGRAIPVVMVSLTTAGILPALKAPLPGTGVVPPAKSPRLGQNP